MEQEIRVVDHYTVVLKGSCSMEQEIRVVDHYTVVLKVSKKFENQEHKQKHKLCHPGLHHFYGL